MHPRPASYQSLVFAFVLASAIGVVYWGAFSSDFIRFDDPAYVTENPMVREGLSLRGVVWSLTAVVKSNWHPLTMLSHMTTVEWVGLDPGGHHAVNVLIHCLNALLLFALLSSATGAFGPSAFAAALFGLHPVHVESVAWVAERKDVLCGFFWLASLAAYLRYAKHRDRSWFYATATLMVLGLLAKPMIVTLPVVLLLLDYWPLNRLHSRASLRELLNEKVPLLALVIVFAGAAVAAQRMGGGLSTNTDVPLDLRLANALGSYALYLGKLVWPVDLALLYPHPDLPGGVPWRAAQLAGSAVLIAALSAACTRAGRFYALGWWWFALSLVPVIGIVQVGAQAMADRYLYLPAIGIYIALAFAGHDFLQRRARGKAVRVALVSIPLLAVGALAFTARAQVGYWRDSESLFRHSLKVAPNSVLANNLGNVLLEDGRIEEAIDRYRAAIALDPDYRIAHRNLSRAYLKNGDVFLATEHLLTARGVAPDAPMAQLLLGGARFREGDVQAAETHFARHRALEPDHEEPHLALGRIYFEEGDLRLASEYLLEALRLQPDSAAVHLLLARTRLQQGQLHAATAHLATVLAIDPNHAAARELLDQLRQRGVIP